MCRGRFASHPRRSGTAGSPSQSEKGGFAGFEARAETDPVAAAELAQQRAQQSEAVKKSRQKMYADAAAGDPEAQARYERMLAARRENYHRKKQAEAEAAQVS